VVTIPANSLMEDGESLLINTSVLTPTATDTVASR